MKELLADGFWADARVAEGKRFLLEAAAEHQAGLTGVRAADGERKVGYEELIRGFGEVRGGGLYFPYLGSGLGNGPLVELADGSVKFDMICGIGVHHFGHGFAGFVEAGMEAAIRDTVMQGNLQQNAESAVVAGMLLERARGGEDESRGAHGVADAGLLGGVGAGAGAGLAHCFLTTSGAMANENALKVAFHKRPGTSRVMAFEHTFAGRTLALSSLTDKAAYRAGLPAALEVDYVPFFDAEHPGESIEQAVRVIRGHAARYPGKHAAMWCELVLGEGGFYPGSREFFAAVCGEAKTLNLVVVADEVQTFGRTSELFAFQHFGLQGMVDVVTVGKMLQICATLFTDALKPAPGIVSQTFTASTSALFAAKVVLEELEKRGMFGASGKNMRMHKRFVERLEDIRLRHPAWIRGPYGIGGMIAFTAFDGSEKTAKVLLKALFEAGVIAFYNGSAPIRIRFLPPLPVILESQVDEVCGILERVMGELERSQK